MKFTFLPYAQTHAFSNLVLDYLSNHHSIQSLYDFGFDEAGVAQAIEQRSHFPVDRQILVSALKAQYASFETVEKLAANIDLLSNENTFTVCTAHQPNLLTGYLYFIYKIAHTIKLAKVLQEKHPDKNFVPVYYIGSEDNDLEELSVFYFNNQRFKWDGNGQSGAFGSMKTEGLKSVIDSLFTLLGPPGKHCDELKDLIVKSYLAHATIADATRYLVNALFGQYGLVILNPDDALLKSSFTTIMKDDLLNHTAFHLQEKPVLPESYKTQAYTRAINLFYLKENLRERIERKGNTWTVHKTNMQWTEPELMAELEAHPERFSPNVILRGLYQETILPNVVFIGGGSEVAYWLQLPKLFHHYGVFYPSIHLRQSVVFVNQKAQSLLHQLEATLPDLFLAEEEWIHQLVAKNSDGSWKLPTEMAQLAQILHTIKQKAGALDQTLEAAADAAATKMQKQLTVMEQKMFRAEKRKLQVQVARIHNLKAIIFPNGVLQERRENFMPWYLNYGADWIATLIENMEPFRHEFLMVEEDV